jgi:hypothetical protein
MVPLSSLWLPILVSAVFVFIASNLLWMALPFWHRKDNGKLPDEGTVVGGLASAKAASTSCRASTGAKQRPSSGRKCSAAP